MQLFLFLLPLQHMKRPALQNKQDVLLRMAFRARKVLGTFEKRALGVAKLRNICFGRKICIREAKMFLTPGKNICCFRAAKFISRAGELGNICIPQQCFRNNVS